MVSFPLTGQQRLSDALLLWDACSAGPANVRASMLLGQPVCGTAILVQVCTAAHNDRDSVIVTNV